MRKIIEKKKKYDLNSFFVVLMLEMKKEIIKEMKTFSSLSEDEFIYSLDENNKHVPYEILTKIESLDSFTFSLFNLNKHTILILDVPKTCKTNYFFKGVKYYV